jgi:acyl carrier protein
MPATQELIDEVRNLLAEAMDIDPADISDEAHFVADLGVDSLMALEVLVVLEKRYKVRIQQEELHSITCLKNVMTLLEAKGIA